MQTTQDEALRKKFSGHRFVTSPIGILKLIGSILFLTSAIISLALQVCISVGWLELMFPILVSICGVLTILLYISTVLGLAKRIPSTWVQLEIGFGVVIVVVTLVFSILVLTNCTSGGAMTILTGAMGIAGTVCLAITAATLFITWRNVDEEVELPAAGDNNPDPKRKSVFI